MSAGKGDRPRTVNKKIYDENYDRIFRKKQHAIEISVYCPECKGLMDFRISQGNIVTYVCSMCDSVMERETI